MQVQIKIGYIFFHPLKIEILRYQLKANHKDKGSFKMPALMKSLLVITVVLQTSRDFFENDGNGLTVSSVVGTHKCLL